MERVRAEKAVWLFCGDSITQGALHTGGFRDYVELLAERVRFELHKPLHIFVNTAYSGDTTREILAQIEYRVIRFDPDIFSLMIGMNDAHLNRNITLDEFRRNTCSIVGRVRESTSAQIILQTTCAVVPALAPERPRFPEYMDVVREVALELDTALVDHHAEWEKIRTKDPTRYESWMANPIHPNALGHWVFAEKLMNYFGFGPLENCVPPRPLAHVASGEGNKR
jgi:lysophospholipase L1-like esterase